MNQMFEFQMPILQTILEAIAYILSYWTVAVLFHLCVALLGRLFRPAQVVSDNTKDYHADRTELWVREQAAVKAAIDVSAIPKKIHQVKTMSSEEVYQKFYADPPYFDPAKSIFGEHYGTAVIYCSHIVGYSFFFGRFVFGLTAHCVFGTIEWLHAAFSVEGVKCGVYDTVCVAVGLACMMCHAARRARVVFRSKKHSLLDKIGAAVVCFSKDPILALVIATHMTLTSIAGAETRVGKTLTGWSYNFHNALSEFKAIIAAVSAVKSKFFGFLGSALAVLTFNVGTHARKSSLFRTMRLVYDKVSCLHAYIIDCSAFVFSGVVDAFKIGRGLNITDTARVLADGMYITWYCGKTAVGHVWAKGPFQAFRDAKCTIKGAARELSGIFEEYGL